MNASMGADEKPEILHWSKQGMAPSPPPRPLLLQEFQISTIELAQNLGPLIHSRYTQKISRFEFKKNAINRLIVETCYVK